MFCSPDTWSQALLDKFGQHVPEVKVNTFCCGVGSRKIKVNIFILLYIFYMTYDLFFSIQCLIFRNSVESKNVCENVIFQ